MRDAAPAADADLERRWRRNQFAVTAASFIGYTGFTLVMPFLPLYISELGERDLGTIALWSGLSIGITPALTALLSPAWGKLADRYGRKIMLERALVSFVIVMTLMAFVTRPWHVFALRALQGLFAGYGGLTVAMAAESAPRARMATAIGLVQTAQRLGPAIGPMIGSVLASLVGLRHSFFVTAGFYLLALILAVVLYVESPTQRSSSGQAATAGRVRFRDLIRQPNFTLLLVAILGIQYADRSLGPILPLYLARGTDPGRVTLASGILFSVLAFAAAVGHHVCGRLLERHEARRVIAGGAAGAAAAIAIFAALPWPSLMAQALTLAVFGLAVGVAMTGAFTAAGMLIPPGAQGTGFGLLNGAALTGLALSPVASGALGGWSMTAVFLLDAVIATAVAALVIRRMVNTPAGPRTGLSDAPVGADD